MSRAITKVIVLGLDGFEPTIVSPMLEAGKLPNLARVQQQGGYGRLQTTCPAQTPVAWATFSTGTNPGGHGIFDFIRRNPLTYLPDLALNRYEQKSVFLPPRVVNLRRGRTVWDLLSVAGLPSTILRCPCTYPPENIHGRLLAGMGVPDLQGGFGTATFYSSAPRVRQLESENVVPVQVDASGRVITHLLGPRNPKTRDHSLSPITLHLGASDGQVALESEGEPGSVVLRQGQWSDWLTIPFKMGFLKTVRGLVRFYLVGTAPHLELYASPINFDPKAPLFPISAPPGYAGELADQIGPFHTAGMVEDHNGLSNGRFDELAFLEQCSGAVREREKMMLHELERLQEGLFFCLFDTPDRVQHMFWRFLDRKHPANDGVCSAEMSQVIEEHYRTCDGIVGRALEYVDDKTLFIVLSDHGFNSFRRGINLNAWLHTNGLLAFKGARPEGEADNLFHEVDWNRTRAYALGLGGIYLNLKGREEQGIVAIEDAPALKRIIAERLSGLADPQQEKAAISRVVSREQVYSGPYTAESPDLIVHCAAGYRVSWKTTLGGIGTSYFEDNRKKWSGDHIIDPNLVPGVVFMNRPFQGTGAGMIDMAPTILDALGVAKGPDMEGASLLV